MLVESYYLDPAFPEMMILAGRALPGDQPIYAVATALRTT